MKTCMLLGICLVAASGLIAQDVDVVLDYIQKGDAAEDDFDNETALKFYTMALSEDSTNCIAMWKVSRAHVNVGEVLEGEEQSDHYRQAEAYARKAVAACPEIADTHLALAIAAGRVALISGSKTKVRLSKVVKESALKCLELDPTNDIAHHVLARWHREVTNLSGLAKTFAKILYGGLPPASYEEAVQHFKKAIELKPEYINHHLELGITYEDMGEWELAKTEYEKVAELPIDDSDDPDHKEEAEQRLQNVLKKL
jgi:tetratricopeptide (TPR) repeat protein